MSRRLLLLAASAPLFLAVSGLGCHMPTPPPPDTSPTEVTVSKPAYKKITQYTELTGQIKAPATVDVRARVSGYISKIDFKDGDDVKAGDVLIEIDPVIYDAQYKQAEGQVMDYKAQIRLYTAELARTTDLIQKGAVSQNEYDQAVAKLDIAKAKLFTGEAQVIQAKQNLDWCKVTSPITGRIDRIFLTPGNVATGGTTEGTVLTTIVSVDPMYAYFDADEQTVLYFQNLIRTGRLGASARDKGLPIEVRLQNEPDYTKHHTGVLDFVSNQLNTGTGSLQIRATLANPVEGVGKSRYFIPGLYVRGRIPAGDPVDAVLIPEEAVVSDQGYKLVYTVGKDNRIVAKKVTLGPMAEGLRMIAQGLSKDDKVVIRGMIRVQPDMVVTPVPGQITPVPDK